MRDEGQTFYTVAVLANYVRKGTRFRTGVRREEARGGCHDRTGARHGWTAPGNEDR